MVLTNKDYFLDGLSTCVKRYSGRFSYASCGDWRIEPIGSGKRGHSNFKIFFGSEPVAYCKNNELFRDLDGRCSDKSFLQVCDIVFWANPDWKINPGEKMAIDRKNAAVR